jgi:hypothetical protein
MAFKIDLPMKYSQWIGIAAALLLVAASYMPWAYFPDLGKEFTGFFSEHNRYGRPGKALTFLSVVMVILFLLPKVWAKRTNIVVAAITIAYAVRCYILFTGCYQGMCPEKRLGIFLVVAAAVITMATTLVPDLPVKQDKPQG